MFQLTRDTVFHDSQTKEIYILAGDTIFKSVFRQVENGSLSNAIKQNYEMYCPADDLIAYIKLNRTDVIEAIRELFVNNPKLQNTPKNWRWDYTDWR